MRERLARLRPPHGWSAVGWELAIVAVGVLIALAAQQWVDDRQWRGKVAVAERSIRAELSNNLGLALEQRLLNGCANTYLDLLREAVVNDDPATISRLAEIGPPLIGRAWPRDTWTAALSSQVPDHLETAHVTAYSRAFLRIGVQREFMQEMESLYPVALSGGFGLPRDAGAAHDQLVAILRLKKLEAQRKMIGTSLLDVDGPMVGASVSNEYLTSDRAFVRRCDAQLREVRPRRP